MNKGWKNIEKINYKNCLECIEDFKKKNYKISPWIEDIVKRNKFDFNNCSFPIKLIKIKVSDFGFTSATELQEIYNKIKDSGFELVPPEIAIFARNLYEEQEKGSWLRFATPMNSMIDSDGVPHLPKLGRALGFYFIETYWAYPKAIFHPHNEFVIMKKNEIS